MFELSDHQKEILKYSIRSLAALFFLILLLYYVDYAYFGNVLRREGTGNYFIVYINNYIAFYFVNISLQLVCFFFSIGWCIYLLDYMNRIKRLSEEHPNFTYSYVTIISCVLLILIGLSILGYDMFVMIRLLS